MNQLPHIASRVFDTPLLIQRSKLDVILSVLGDRVGLSGVNAAPNYAPPIRAALPSQSSIGLIPIHGTLVRRALALDAASGLSSYDEISARLDAALSSPDVAAILLDIDSPGGESGGVFDLANRIRAASKIKPIWAVANDMAFSAAYAIASAAERVFVTRTGGVGSIGVIALHVDQSEKDAKDGLRYTAVFAGNRKNDLNPHEPITSEAHSVLEAEVKRLYGMFVDTVSRHRGMKPAAIRGTEAGLFFGNAAIDAGLADAVGTLDDAINQLITHVSVSQSTKSRDNRRAGQSLVQERTAMTLEVQDSAAVDTSAAVEPTAQVALEPVAASETHATASQATTHDALEIAQLCALAGRSDLIAGFLEAAATPAAVRTQLLAMRATASPEITSHIAPQTKPALSSAISPSDIFARRAQR